MEQTQEIRSPEMAEADYIRLRNYLEENGITQKFLCDKIGKSKSWINKVLNGETDISLEMKARIEKSLQPKSFKFKSSSNEEQS